MRKLAKLLMVSLLATITSLITLPAYAAHGGGGGGGFSFTYTITNNTANYHAYNLVCQVGCNGTNQPAGTVILGLWYVRDLGPVSGTHTVSCTTPTCPTGKSLNITGKLFFADAGDIGGDGSTFVHAHPVAEVTQWTSSWYNGDDFIGVFELDNTEPILYMGPRFTPFAWDLSPYLY